MIIFLILTLTIFSCTGKKENSLGEIFKDCECEKTIKSDSIFFAANIQSKRETEQHVLIFNCATIETAIASVSDINGNNERCENLYDIKCISNSNKILKLAKNFTYNSAEMQNMDITSEGAQYLFFEEIKNNNKKYFEFNLNNKREIIAISKLIIK